MTEDFLHERAIGRRDFLAAGTGLAATLATGHALGQEPQESIQPTHPTGANDRIGIGLIGCGGRCSSYLPTLRRYAQDKIEIVAVCDVWRRNREATAARIRQEWGNAPQEFSRYQDLLALADVDAVFIATPDFSHSVILADAVRAGKDAYVEKPMSTRLEDAILALDTVRASDRIVQVGTQRRSDGRFKAGAAVVQSGRLGKVSRVDAVWNRNVASWARPFDDVREEDVDWEAFLLYLPRRPFDPARFRCWHLSYEFTNGLVGLIGSHVIDVALWFLQDPLPTRGVALGGLYVWNDGREISDTFECVLEYPKGWMLVCSCWLGSGPEDVYAVFHGQNYNLDTRDWLLHPAAHERPKDAQDEPIRAQDSEDHLLNFLECVRTRRTPNCDIEAGFAHSIACILAREAERTGRRMRYKPATRTIVEG